MKAKGRIALILLFTSLLSSLVFGQEEVSDSKIDREMNRMLGSHPIKLAIFRIQPKFVFGSAYDSNTFSSPIGLEVQDSYFIATPGISVATKFGNSAYFSVDQDVALAYHRKVEGLRGITRFTSFNFTTGSERFLFTATGGFSNPKSRVSVEFDQPIQQHKTNAGLNLIYGFRPSTDLSFLFSRVKTKFDRDLSLVTELPIPANTLTVQYGAGAEHILNDSVRLTFDGRKGYYQTLGSTNFDKRDFWNVLPGFVFTGDKLTGTAKAGYGQTQKSAQKGNLNDLLLLVDVDYLVKSRWTVGGSASRSRQISDLITNSFRVTSEGSLRTSIPISDPLSITFFARMGKNDYGEEFFARLGPITKDNFYLVGSTLSINLPGNFVMNVGGDYLNRDSNQPLLTKRRFLLRAGLVLQGS